MVISEEGRSVPSLRPLLLLPLVLLPQLYKMSLGKLSIKPQKPNTVDVA